MADEEVERFRRMLLSQKKTDEELKKSSTPLTRSQKKPEKIDEEFEKLIITPLSQKKPELADEELKKSSTPLIRSQKKPETIDEKFVRTPLGQKKPELTDE